MGLNYKLALLSFISIFGCVYYWSFLNINGYLPAPFPYDKNDTFMDLFHVIYWAYDTGRYTVWNSVYPPLNFIFARILDVIFGGQISGASFDIRSESSGVISGLIALYFLVPLVVINTSSWRVFSKITKFYIYVLIILSPQMLFTLERGNLIILTPVFLSFIFDRNFSIRVISIAILINLKPYFLLLTFFYLFKKDWKGFLICILISGLLFGVTGLLFDSNFLNLFHNMSVFSSSERVVSLKDTMSLPSSISAFSQVLSSPSIINDMNAVISQIIDAFKWIVIVSTMLILARVNVFVPSALILTTLVVLITNLGAFTGGYTLIFYMVLIPFFLKLNFKLLYLTSIVVMSMPLDLWQIQSYGGSMQYSYLSDSVIFVEWDLSLGSLIRPLLNIFILILLSFEILRTSGSSEVPPINNLVK